MKISAEQLRICFHQVFIVLVTSDWWGEVVGRVTGEGRVMGDAADHYRLVVNLLYKDMDDRAAISSQWFSASPVTRPANSPITWR